MARLFDLHCHTSRYSICSSLSPEEYIGLAWERGIDGLCLTEHDERWDNDEMRALAAEARIIVVAGMELTTDAGHVLAYGLPREAASASFATLARNARQHGALLYLAHPARDGLLRLEREVVDALASVEVLNGSDTKIQNMAAQGLAHRFALPGIGGSDAHAPAEVGQAGTLFVDDIASEADFLDALRDGRYSAVVPPVS
jgi:predicted metal-dependent phosphoesterase TrpH